MFAVLDVVVWSMKRSIFVIMHMPSGTKLTSSHGILWDLVPNDDERNGHHEVHGDLRRHHRLCAEKLHCSLHCRGHPDPSLGRIVRCSSEHKLRSLEAVLPRGEDAQQGNPSGAEAHDVWAHLSRND